MANIKIDGKDYDVEKLNEEAKKQLSALQIVDAEIRHLQIQLGIANTARNVHLQLLKTAAEDPLNGDTIKLG